MTPRTTALFLTMLFGAAASAAGQSSIYRCGPAYAALPCGDDARPVLVAAAVSAERRAEAREVAAREKALAAEMARDRRAEEARLRPALAGSLSGPGAKPAAPAATPKKHSQKRKARHASDDDRDFVAAVPPVKKSAR